MKRNVIASVAALSAMTATLLASPSEALAAACSALTNPAYFTGSSAVKPLLKTASAPLLAATPSVQIVYKSQGSCTAPDAIVNGTKITGTGIFWDGAGTETTCDLTVGGDTVDVGVSDVYSSSCNVTLTTGQKDFFGPVQVMNIIAPIASTETSISAEALYAIFGYGGTTYQVAPWSDVNFLMIRNATSGTQQMWANAIGLPASKWKGQDKGGSGAVLTAVSGSATPNATLGILASDVADVNRATIKILAYQHKGQKCAYLPDSSTTTFDKINVREGRYATWGPLHVITNVDGQGNPSNARAAQVVNYFTRKGLSDALKKTQTDAEIAAHTIPLCAMKVSRTAEVGAESSFQPDEPCGCYFDSKVGTAPASCKACPGGDTDCTGTVNTCRFGYCEAK